MMVSLAINKPVNHALQTLRDDLEAAEFVNEMKDMDIAELKSTLARTEEWADAMHDRAWKAEAAAEECERELKVVKAELWRLSQKYSHIRMSAYPTGTPPSPLGSEADLLDDGWPPLRFKDPSEPDISAWSESFGLFVKRVDSDSSC